ncbi:SAM-dependent methyltransferase [Frondihabitans sucicola]|uniref:SAM-dependent methyltransferase n=1 Tax=Frondihabitans sucicola TaxID=1268041 RepID=A0ABM8GJ91_9MICO|nr:class I SAM-dependent methyltransferase [Frondihabitans sucicola]BDZ48431.1 SAM-dependent methyltransferase [Frondihabitans sucicola]
MTDNAFWQDRYSRASASGEQLWSAGPNAWIEQTVGHLPIGEAVDLAAGEGRNALWLAARGWTVTAVDFAPAGLAIGRARAAELGVEVDWVEADATSWISPSLVDLVVVAYLQLPADALADALANASASLAPGGTLALVGHALENLADGVGGPQDPALLHRIDHLSATARAVGLDVEECRLVARDTAAGTALDAVLVAARP